MEYPNIFKVGDNNLIEEYYFIGSTKCDSYAIYANKSGHYPIRVWKQELFSGGFRTKRLAIKHSIKQLKFTISLLEKINSREDKNV